VIASFPGELETKLRHFVLLLLAGLVGCSESPQNAPPKLDDHVRSEAAPKVDRPWGGLKIQTAGASLDDADQIVVLLHGYGATESDLVPLADYLGGKSRAFVFPAAPVAVDGGGLAWATTENELATAQEMLESLVRFASASYPNAEISLGGFSQGATVSSMLLTDAAIPVRHMILYSPALAIEASAIDPPPNIHVLLAHGKMDDVLPFADAERLHRMLTGKGVQMNWLPFDGGHTITPEVLDATKDQLSRKSGEQ
jgi:phospholipase/carboxylesterase